jgi:hypothetical protein
MQASALRIQEANIRDGRGGTDQTLRTDNGARMEYCRTESGGPYLWSKSNAGYSRLEILADGTGRKIKAVDLTPNVQSTFAVIVASVDECSQQFVVPD